VPSNRVHATIRIGLLADGPIRLAGFSSILDQPAEEGQAQLVSIIGSREELLNDSSLDYLVVDLGSSSGGWDLLESICRSHPSVPLIVIGPEGNDELVMNSIAAGSRAFLDLSAGPVEVRHAIDVVHSGSIWAPRRLLSKLIDRLLKASDASLTNARIHLTDREQEVLELILQARSNREIAGHLGIEERTVKAHVGRLMRKTGTDNRIELSMLALEHHLGPHIAESSRRSDQRKRELVFNG
jgi:DNA-binding NarL/FixJ family response regulator